MDLRVIGAGLGRTGTHSLKLALERLLGAPCYHMVEVFAHPEHVSAWHSAAEGRMPDWHTLLAGYAAAVDWPAGAFWPELSEAFPDALVVLSVRDPQSWWESAHNTIFQAIPSRPPDSDWRKMIDAMMTNRFTSALDDPQACIAAFERHNARVRETVPRERLLEWNVAEGWAPLCAALGVPIPEEPFPRTNTREEWLARRASVLDQAQQAFKAEQAEK
ncbi:MAG TPA: sulfotransferase [Chthonomonadaceae bacterium]|nr:sulfotransferase [Chthonomonadaceae bacterium]